MNNYDTTLDDASTDILKLNLLKEDLKKLKKPLSDLIENKHMSINDLRINSITGELIISLKSDGTVDDKIVHQFKNTLIDLLTNSLSQYTYD